MHQVCEALGALLIAALVSLPAAAQTSLGTMVGNVTDESAAAIPGVTVNVTNELTGARRTVTTTSAGTYAVPSLPPGVYSISAEMTGFQTAVRSGVGLEVNQTLRVDLTLRVGEVTERVEVVGQATLLQTDTSTVATTVDNKKVVELPLNGRSFTQLTILVPGAVPGAGANTAFQVTGTSVSVSGLRSEANNYTLDGVNNNETFFKTFGLQPSIDAIQEFRIQTNVTSAEFGTGAGANVNVVTKSGTNEFHGSAFFFHRNDNFDATDFFANATGRGKPEFRQHQFGGTVGGPVRKNKTFFFVMYDATRRSRGSTLLASIPTPEMLAGDLSRDLLGQPAPVIFDPATTREQGNLLLRSPFPGNIIPSARLHPAIVDYSRIFIPAPNLPGQTANLVNPKDNVLDSDQWMFRGDQRFGDNNTLTGRFNISDASNRRPTALTTVDNFLGNTFTNIMVSDTHTLGASTVLEIRAGYHRNNLQILDSSPGGREAVVDYINRHQLSGVPPFKAERAPLYPQLTVAGLFGVSQTGFPFPDDTYSLMGSMSRVAGKHLIKAGFDFRHMRNLDDGFFTGNFTFTKDATVDPQNVGATGQGLAAYLLGLPNTALRNIGDTTAIMRKQDYSFYIQDDYKVTPKLTLNLGLRYDLIGWPVHRDDKLGSFDLGTGQFIWDGRNPITGEAPNVRRGIVEPDRNNLAPRFGMAYRLGDRNTIRAGYGIFYMANYLWETQGVRGNWPFAISETLSNLNVRFPDSPIERTFTPELSVQPGSAVRPSAQHIINRNNRTSYTQQWNLHVQRQLAQDLMVELGYVGTKGTKLSNFVSANTALPGAGPVDPRRPFPILGATSLMTNESTSSYHGLQAKIDKRFDRGLAFRGNYSFGKTIDIGGAGFGAGSSPQDPLNWSLDRALSALHRAHIFTLDYIWQIPFGKGTGHFENLHPAAEALLGGWQLTGIMAARSGSPYNIGIPRDIANIGARTIAQRPHLVGDPFAGAKRAPDLWFNRSAFAEPAAFTFGSLTRHPFTGPGVVQFDFGGYKNFTLTEQIRLQFRAEFFNFFNNVNFSNPDGNFDSPNFGRILGSDVARQIQFGLKVLF